MCTSEQVNPARTLKEKKKADHFCRRGHICFLTCTDVYGPWEPPCAAGHYTPVHSSCSSISTASSGLRHRSSSLCVSVMFHVLGSSNCTTCPLSPQELGRITEWVFSVNVWTTGPNQRLGSSPRN